VLAELAERLDPEKLAAAAATVPVAWAQRLGYLLEHVRVGDKLVALKADVHARAHETTALLPQATHENTPRDDVWKLYVNAAVETDL
jgi:hypothetical protein